MKVCKDCQIEKPQSEFYGKQTDCKDCFRARGKANRLKNIDKYRKYDKERQRYNPTRVFNSRYYAMKARVEGRGTHPATSYGKGICTKKEWLEWCEETKHVYDRLFKEWAKNGFVRGLTPSVDRVDNTKGYVLGNMQWLTQRDNTAKDAKGFTGHKDPKTGQFTSIKK